MTSTVSTLDAGLLTAVETAAHVLKRVGAYRLEPKLDERMRRLGENKEACSADEREEYMAWVDFCQSLTHDKLQALLALKRLRDALPDLEVLSNIDTLLDPPEDS